MEGVSVIIKALNEEKYIEAAIQSALTEVKKFGGEVILADSGSTDQTIEIASKFPITIVQLADPNEASCGIGPQLGYLETKGEYLYLLDGDMELVPGFIKSALNEFKLDQKLAGVGGLIEDTGQISSEYHIRNQMAERGSNKGIVSHLGCGGMYRTSAIKSVGYFSNRNLHSFEELELGVRLSHAGWKMIRLSKASIRHHIHQNGSYALLLVRWKTRRWMGAGECIRSALGKGHFSTILPKFMFLYITAIWLITLFFVLTLPIHWLAKLLIASSIFIFPFTVMSMRYKDFGSGVYGVISWVFSLAGVIRGLLTPQVDPTSPIIRKVIKQGAWVQGQIGGQE